MDYNTMDQYTFKVSRCDWDCLTSALMNKCDLGSRKLPTCQQAFLRCEDTGGCDIQCDDTTKRNMPPIENDGLKTFLKERRILCRRAEAWVITSRCEECDIELKTMRLRLPKKRERLACETVQEMLDQNLLQFDCIYKVCDCQEEDNRLIANCKVTNIETTNNGNGNANIEEGPQEAPETTTTTLHFTTPQNMKKGKRTKSPKNKKNVSTTASTTSKVSSTTKTGKKKGKGQNSSKKDEESESEHDDTTTSGSKKEKKKKKGNNNNENTTSMSVTSRNSREQTSSGSDQVTGAVEPASTIAGQKKTKGKKKKGKDNGESTTSSTTGRDRRRKGYGRRCHVNENGTSIETTDINVTSGTTTIASQTAVHRGSGGNSEETTFDSVDPVSGLPGTTAGDVRVITDQTSGEVKTTGIENEATSDYFDYKGNSTESWTRYTDHLDSVNGSVQRHGIHLETSTEVRTRPPENVTPQRSGLPMHQTPVFSYALAGGVAGIVLILLIVLCIALFDKDRKRKMKQRKFLDSMNLPPPPTELRNGRSSSKRKSSVRFSATPSVGDQIRSPTKMKSFSLKKTDQPDANSV